MSCKSLLIPLSSRSGMTSISSASGAATVAFFGVGSAVALSVMVESVPPATCTGVGMGQNSSRNSL